MGLQYCFCIIPLIKILIIINIILIISNITLLICYCTVSKPAPHWEGTAVVNGKFKELKLEDFKGKVFHAKDDTCHACFYLQLVCAYCVTTCKIISIIFIAFIII